MRRGGRRKASCVLPSALPRLLSSAAPPHSISLQAWGVDAPEAWEECGATLGRGAQGEVHCQADAVLDAQHLHDAGLGQPEVREREGGPGEVHFNVENWYSMVNSPEST